jgi:HEAT repeat protein
VADLSNSDEKSHLKKANMKTQFFRFPSISAALLLILAASSSFAAGAASSTDERELIAVLQSSAPPQDKAITCKRLAVYGTEAAVPALAPLLLDPHLTSWARIALEAIPGPASEKALREAMEKANGLVLVGIINSIGVRRDAKAVSQLASKMKDSDPEVASAAAVALGRIGGPKSAKDLTAYLSKAPTGVRTAVAEGCIRCAEIFVAEGKANDAVKLYDTVRKSEVPKQKLLEATRGAILARKSGGIPLLVEQLRSTDQAFFGIGLRTARELPGADATTAVVGELKTARADRQPLILLALADRNDPGAMPTILEAAKTGSKELRLTAVSVLDRLGKPVGVPVLLEIAADQDSAISQAALAALARMSGDQLDSEILGRLKEAKGKDRQVAIELAGRRGIEKAVVAIVACAQDPEPAIRSAALQTLGTIGGPAQITDLVKLLEQTNDPKGRDDVEAALMAITARAGTGCAQGLLPLAQSDNPRLRIVALHALASAGGSDALKTLTAAVEDKAESVRDEAVRTLSNWPNTWPEDEAITAPLLSVAKSAQKPSYQVLASRGYLQFLEGDKKLKADEKVSKVKEILPLLTRPEEKQLAIAVIKTAPSPDALDVLVSFAGETALADDACSAIVDIARKNSSGIPKQDRQKALLTVADKSTSDDVKRKAEDALKRIE